MTVTVIKLKSVDVAHVKTIRNRISTIDDQISSLNLQKQNEKAFVDSFLESMALRNPEYKKFCDSKRNKIMKPPDYEMTPELSDDGLSVVIVKVLKDSRSIPFQIDT